MSLPASELEIRLQKVRELLTLKNLSCGLIYYDELNIANGWYLSGWCPQFESGAVLVPVQGEPMILGGPESEPFAQIDSAIKKTRNIPVFMVPEEEYPNAYISSFAEVFKEIGMSEADRRVGIVGLEKMPLGVYQRLLAELEGVELVDLTPEYENFRKLKSPWEIEQIKQAFAIADESIKIMEELVREGVFETEIAGAGEGRARSLGANWFAFKTIVASGIRSNGVVPTASSEKSLQNGETLMVGISPRFNGYAGVAGYTYVVGNKINEAQRTCFNDMVEAYRITKSNLVPGAKGRDIDSKTREFLVKKGYAKYLVCPFVHTIGLMEAEAPFFGPNSNDTLQPGMTVCIDVSVFSVPEVNGIRLESGYLITENGAVPLSPFMEQKILNSRI
ncbi:MAG TPA: Xaa-Pro peptidase family protein [Candidatus Atribacteria bacterium]|nr:Xaa-Pro peptidase family protein [Candidatus Atribacteria bacterium]